MPTFYLRAEKWRITGRRHLVQIMEKLIIAYGSCQTISAFYILRPPEVPSVPFHASSWVAKQAADAQSAAAATHECVYLAGERRQRLCRPISTVTPTTVWNCECNSLNTGMEVEKGDVVGWVGGGVAAHGKNCSFISWLLSSSPPSPRASDY